MAKVKMAKCPVCDDSFEVVSDLYVGAIVQCPGCYTELKILRLSPVEVEEVSSSGNFDYYEDEDEQDEDQEPEYDDEKLFDDKEDRY